MDPLSCLSIATGIITFVDFGAKLIWLSVGVRKSEHGRPTALSALETELRELSGSAALARDKITSLQELYPRQYESLTRLSAECVQAEKELRSLTDSLTMTAKSTGGGHGFRGGTQALLVSIRAMRKQGDVDSLQDRLRRIREQTMMTVMLCILENVTEAGVKLKSVDDGVKEVLDSLRPEMATTINDLQPEFRSISRNVRPLATDAERNNIAEGLWVSIATADKADYRASSSVVEKLPESDHAICNRIIKILEFDDMRAREVQIATAFPETFRWILDGDGGGLENSSDNSVKAGKRPLTKFTTWLESPADDADTPFWITGKAASGKSTLMKLICNSPQVQTHLQAWAGQSQLLICSVYFWNPGSSGQKSQVGLLCTLLHQLLSQRPDLCREVALKRYLYFQLAGLDATNPPNWTLKELQDCLIGFISAVDGTSRLAVFIDGLDEYEGSPEGLIDFLKHLHDTYRIIKLCISSRPWNIFKDAFCTYPSLRMELLTKPDIEKYVIARIGSNRALQELRALDPTSVENLEAQIINKAEGVFLWVVLVTEKVIATASDNNDLAEIWRIFETLPQGLEELYNSMLRRLEPALRERASRMYQLLLRWNAILDRPFGILEFWVATNCHDPIAQLLQDFLKDDDVPRILPLVERGLAGATGGILQVQHSPESTIDKPEDDAVASSRSPEPPLKTVGFLHRTVFEWLQNIEPSIVSDGPPDYDPALVLTSVLVSQVNQGIISNHKDLSELARYTRHTKEAFMAGRSCKDSAESRARLLAIIQHLKLRDRHVLELKYLEPSHSHLFAYPYTDSHVRTFLGVIFLCAPYLQAQLESPSASIAGLEMPRIVQSLPSIFWDKRRTQLVSTILDKLLDYAKTRDREILNMILRIFEILLRARFAPRRVLQTAVKRRPKDGHLPPDVFLQALLDGLAGKGFNDITRPILEDLDIPGPILEDSESSDESFAPPLRTWTGLRGERARGHIHRGFREYMHDQKVRAKAKVASPGQEESTI